MIFLKATCKHGNIILDETLLAELEGRQLHVLVQEIPPDLKTSKRRQRGSAKGLLSIAPDFDAPLDDFRDYVK
ncbi:DUF2281 domain-containing protein [Candidatus Cyanaurora vandensis]|uniref:DUF2281 domain-containing protein n=1 Tax=Candidatus Cyanaurora vandensis TaxID=2714958 RepID=UPI00257B3F06|nr:DUF2281 domain-containing protein [Candidatus Cyanaurora vandensis]